MVKVSGTGTGTVTSSPVGINITYPGQTQDSLFTDLGQNVVITAQAGSGYSAFFNDTCTDMGGTLVGENTSTATCTLSAKLVKNLFVEFKTAEYTLTITKSGTGTGTVSAGSGCSLTWVGHTGTCKVPYNTTITLTATPDTDKTFTGFSSGTGSASVCDGVTGTCTFQLQSNSSVTANFSSGSSTQRVVTVYLTGDLDGKQRAGFSYYGGGCTYVMYGPNSVSCYVNEGQTVYLGIMNNSQAIRFTGFTGDVTSTDTSVSINVDGDKLIYANFSYYCIKSISPTYKEFNNSGGSGTISVDTYSGSCNWTITSASAWITIDSSGSESGSKTVSFTVANNGASTPRTGTIMISDGFINKTFTIYQLNRNNGGLSYQWHRLDGGLTTNIYKPISTMDSSGNIYVLANSNSFNSGNNGANNATPIVDASTNRKMVVMKYNKDGVYHWHTFVPGDSTDYKMIAVSGNGIYTVATANGSVGSPIRAFSGSDDFVVTKLNQNGIYQWHTYLGGTGTDYPRGIVVDSSNNVYVVGSSTVSWGSPIVNMNAGITSAVIAKLNSNGVLQWNTFVNHTASSSFQAISVGADDNVYIGGSISGSQWGSPVNYKTNQDAVVFKYDGNGNRLWHTYFGSTSTGGVQAIAVDNSNNVYALINSSASWTGPANEQPRRTYTSGSEYSVIKLSSSGSYLWHTFLGFSSYDSKNKLTVDRDGNIYIGGANTSYLGGETKDIPALRPFDDKSAKWGIQKIDSNGYYQWHFYHGGKVSSDSAYSNFYSIYACKYETCKNELVVTGGGSQYWEFIDTLNPSVPKNWITITGTTSQDITVLKFLLYPELRVTVSGAGTGTITSNPTGINITYPGQTSGSFLLETPGTVVLTAQAHPGYVANLGGTCQLAGGTVSGDNSSIVTCSLSSLSMRRDVSLLFTSGTQYPISVTKLGTGTGVITSNPPGLNCGSTCTANFGANEKITLFITPSPGSSVAQVKIGGISLGPVNAVTIRGMNANHSLEVTFSSP